MFYSLADTAEFKMKKIVIGVMVLCVFSSCGNKKTNIDPFESLTNLLDSVKGDTAKLNAMELNAETDPVPSKADETFDDFIYSFASDKEMQKQRVLFPLPFYNKDVPSKIERKLWKHDYFFTKQDYYTLLFDRESDMELVQDTSLTSVQFEWIYMKTRMAKKYYFEKKKNAWILEAINLYPIKEGGNESFIDFFYKFATDSVFQSEHLRDPLTFVTTDPDDDFAIMESSLDLYQWPSFRPTLPTDRLTNINYGQQLLSESRNKILEIKGNGFSNTLHFRRTGDGWELYKFEDISN